MSSLLLLSLVGLGLFYLQHLAFLTQVHLMPLSILLLYAGLRHPLSVAFLLAGFLGLLQDSYAITPSGLHLMGALLLVAIARACRPRFLIQHPVSQFLVSLAALILQESGIRLILLILGFSNAHPGAPDFSQAMEIVFTAALAPLIFALMRNLEKAWGRRARVS